MISRHYGSASTAHFENLTLFKFIDARAGNYLWDLNAKNRRFEIQKSSMT
jgi:hypothetical protein